jgi:hypothetical protein
MKKHICKQCNKVYEYCRGCLLSPISYKENGYCSETCYEASKIKINPIVEEIVEPIIAEDVAPIDEEISIEIATEVAVVEEAPVEVKAESIALTETTTVDKPIIKKETSNTYKKKKNKYRVHE